MTSKRREYPIGETKGRKGQKLNPPNLIPSLRNELTAFAEPGYRDFSQKLTPTKRKILGVRVPALRRIAARLVRQGTLPFSVDAESSHEEILVAGMILARSPIPVERLLTEIDAFLAVADNWAVCDTFCAELKIVKKEPEIFWRWIAPLFRDEREFYVRFACVLLLDYFVCDEFIDEALARLTSVRHPAYYARMGGAWAFSVCFVHFPDKTLRTLRRTKLLDDIRQKSVRKILESFRISDDVKVRLRDEFRFQTTRKP